MTPIRDFFLVYSLSYYLYTGGSIMSPRVLASCPKPMGIIKIQYNTIQYNNTIQYFI